MPSRLGKIELKQPIQGIPVASSVLANVPLSWSEDNIVALTTTNGVCIFELSFGPNGDQAGLPFDRIYISTPDTPNPHILSGSALQLLVNSIKNVDECQSIMLDATLTAAHRAGIEISSNRHNQNGIGNAQGIDLNHVGYSKAVWSYKGATERDECLLCLVTFDHQIRLVGQVGIQWKMLFDITSLWAKYISHDEKKILDQYQASVGTENYHRFIAKTRLQGIAGISWTHPLTNPENETFSVLLIATTSSHLALIKVPRIKNRSPVEPCVLDCFSLDNSLGKISALEWISLNSNGGLVCIGTIKGYIEIHYLSLKPKYQLKQLLTFENALLGMHVNHLQLASVDIKKNQYILFSGKHNILEAYLLKASSSKTEVLASTQAMLGCFQISGIKIIDPNLIYVSTKDGEMKRVEMEFDFKAKKVSFGSKEILFSSKGKVFYNGFCFSPNNTFFAILECLSVPHDHLQLREPTVINLFQGDAFICLMDHILENNGKTLCEQIDIFESIRLLTYRNEVTFPSIEARDICSLSNYFKKVYVWLITIELSVLSRSGQSPEKIKEKEELRDTLEKSILTDYISDVFSSLTKESLPSDDKHRLSLHLMCIVLQQNKQQHPFLKMLKNQLKTEKFSGTEVCLVCSTPVDFTSVKVATCSKGHSLPRCLRTLLPTPPISMCSYCNLFYHSEASKWYGEIATTCLICLKKLKPRVGRS